MSQSEPKFSSCEYERYPSATAEEMGENPKFHPKYMCGHKGARGLRESLESEISHLWLHFTPYDAQRCRKVCQSLVPVSISDIRGLQPKKLAKTRIFTPKRWWGAHSAKASERSEKVDFLRYGCIWVAMALRDVRKCAEV